MDQRPEQPPEGKLIAEAAASAGISIREAARRAGISYGRWRQVTQGYQNVSPGSYATVRAPARTLARMAAAVHVTAEQMEEAGRPDAAEIMREQPAPDPGPSWAPPFGPGRDPAREQRARPYVDRLYMRYAGLRAAGHDDPDGTAMLPGLPWHARLWDELAADGRDVPYRTWRVAELLAREYARQQQQQEEEGEEGEEGSARDGGTHVAP